MTITHEATPATAPAPRPMFDRTTVTVQCVEGPEQVPALVHPRVPGLAVTMAEFGIFGVTHLASGRLLSGRYERYGRALLLFAELAAIGTEFGIDYSLAGPSLAAALREVYDRPVPFDNATVTDASGTRPMTVREWLACIRNWVVGIDEFPWESPDEAPDAKALELLGRVFPEPTTGVRDAE